MYLTDLRIIKLNPLQHVNRLTCIQEGKGPKFYGPLTLVVQSQKMQLYDRILKANVKMLIFTLYNKIFQKPANVPPVYGNARIVTRRSCN